MDPGMLSQMQMLQANGGSGGNTAICGILAQLPPSFLEATAPMDAINVMKMLQMIFPLQFQGVLLNFPGGTLWKYIFAKIVEILNQQIDTSAGISGGESMSSGSSLSAPSGGSSGGSGVPEIV